MPAKAEQVRRRQRLDIDRRRLACVEYEGLERAPGKAGDDSKAMSAAEPLRRVLGPFDGEREEVTEIASGRVDQGVEQLLLVGLPRQIDVLRRPCPVLQSQVECEPSFEHPLARRNVQQPRQEPIEHHPLAIPRHTRPVTAGPNLQAILQSASERRRGPVLHTCTRRIISSTNSRTRVGRPAIAACRRRWVVSPRSSACPMASSTCSGCSPSS